MSYNTVFKADIRKVTCYLKILYKDYIIALRNFNHFKNCHSHSELNIKKRLYKKYEARAKRLYKKSEGDRLELLKKNNDLS